MKEHTCWQHVPHSSSSRSLWSNEDAFNLRLQPGNITSWQSCIGYAAVGFASGIAGYYGTPILGGAVGGAVGTALGGGIGAFAGGASASVTCDLLNGGKENVDWQNALIAGGASLGIYSAGMYRSWKAYGGKIAGRKYGFGSYYRMQGWLQRYNTYGKSFEIGANVYAGKNGYNKFGRIKANFFGVDVGGQSNAIGDVHAHYKHGKGHPFHVPTDIGTIYNEPPPNSSDYFSDVWGYDGKVYSTTYGQVRALGLDKINMLGSWDGEDFEHSIGEFNYLKFVQDNNFIHNTGNYNIQPFFNYFIK